ncbi:unnamed protein product [Prorocentrum cordatum]|uniref:RanBP2-type domain-containing protein n=1 Tax=Prorocentrum cordatum TaxID=2364126 RepID=A0ABN9T910_9DINO|nr:unnamed protein product [Polarella glacialis]
MEGRAPAVPTWGANRAQAAARGPGAAAPDSFGPVGVNKLIYLPVAMRPRGVTARRRCYARSASAADGAEALPDSAGPPPCHAAARRRVLAGGPIERRDGDWDCPRCGKMVFASKSECFACGEPKPSGGGGGRGRSYDRGGGGRGGYDDRDDRRGGGGRGGDRYDDYDDRRRRRRDDSYDDYDRGRDRRRR